MSILGLSRWNKNWNVRNSYSYVATAKKILFHFQFPRSPDAEFGGLIGWLFNWKCKFSCRIISKIANYLKYNYVWDGDGIENVTSRLWKFSYFCSRHTVGVAGDDIMFHILVRSCVTWCPGRGSGIFHHLVWLDIEYIVCIWYAAGVFSACLTYSDVWLQIAGILYSARASAGLISRTIPIALEGGWYGWFFVARLICMG